MYIYYIGTRQHGHLSTFFGVIIPCTLSMFSIILFLRVGYFIGQVCQLISIFFFEMFYVEYLCCRFGTLLMNMHVYTH